MKFPSEKYEEWRPQLIRIAQRITGNLPDAEDVVQNTFLRFFANEDRSVHNLKAYLSQAVANQAKSYREWWNHRNSTDLPEQVENKEAQIPNLQLYSAELTEWLTELQGKLPQREQGIFLLKEYFQFSYEDLAALYEVKADNARQIFSRAQKRFHSDERKFPVCQNRLDQLRKAMVSATSDGYLQPLILTLAPTALGLS